MLQAPTRATLAPDGNIGGDGQPDHAFIEGDNLEVLKVLHRSYTGRVKLIYIDPPYNTGEDFIYPDDFADPLGHYLSLTGQADANGNLQSSRIDRAGRYHSNWLSMMYPRLSHARQLLREDGFIAVSIDDKEMPNIIRLMDEVFDEENRIAVLVYDRNRKNDAKLFSVGHEYMVVYARNKAQLREDRLVLRASKEGVEDIRIEFERLRAEHGDAWQKVRAGLLAFYAAFAEDDPRLPLARFRKVDERGPYRDDGDISWPGGGGPRYWISHPRTRKPVKLPVSGWRFPTRRRFLEEWRAGRIEFGPDEKTVPAMRRNLFDANTQVMGSVIYSYAQTAAQQFAALFDGRKTFDNPKSFADLEAIVRYMTEPGDFIMDFFAGSNTTLHAVLLANAGESVPRRAVAVQLPEPIKPGSEAANNALAPGLHTLADLAHVRGFRLSRASARRRSNTTGQRAYRPGGRLGIHARQPTRPISAATNACPRRQQATGHHGNRECHDHLIGIGPRLQPCKTVRAPLPPPRSSPNTPPVILTRLTLTEFRNYPALTWQPRARLQVITGPNGSGKTNLLEAVSLLVPGRGLRNARLADLPRLHSQNPWGVAAQFADGLAIGTGCLPDGPADRRVFRLDGEAPRSQAAIAARIAAVWLTPQMDRLFGEGASGRRRFLDRLVWALEPGHAREVAAHDTAMASRNRLLAQGRAEQGGADPAWLAGLEDSMARHAVAAAAARATLVAQLNAALDTGAAGRFPAARMDLLDPVAARLQRAPALAVEDWLRTALRDARAADAVAGSASLGAHRADMALADAATGLPAALSSTGQQKALLLGVVLGHAALITAARGAPPVLLLDEPAVHLDAERRRDLLDALAAIPGTIVLTGTDPEVFAPLQGLAEGWTTGNNALRGNPAFPAPRGR